MAESTQRKKCSRAQKNVEDEKKFRMKKDQVGRPSRVRKEGGNYDVTEKE